MGRHAAPSRHLGSADGPGAPEATVGHDSVGSHCCARRSLAIPELAAVDRRGVHRPFIALVKVHCDAPLRPADRRNDLAFAPPEAKRADRAIG
jgi:hypothetical protein